MASGTVAQFAGSILSETSPVEEPTASQITLDRDQLCVDSTVITEDDDTEAGNGSTEDEVEGLDAESVLEISLDSIFDIVLGPPPQAIAQRFTTETVTIAYEDGPDRRVLHIGNPDEDIVTRFGNFLFMSILNGTDVVFRHPAEIGGRVTDQSPASGTLYITDNAVKIVTPTGSFKIPPNAVIDFTTTRRVFDDEETECVSVAYVRDGTSIHAEISVDSHRKINLLGRFLRRQYRELRRDLGEFDLSEHEVRVLTKLYTLGGQAKVQSLLSERSQQAIETLAKLDGRNLIGVKNGRVTMTPEAWIIVTDRIEQVND